MAFEADLKPGDEFDGKFEILEVLGAGARGVVYKVRHLILDDICALKIIKQEVLDSDEAKSRFTREIKLAGQLQDHPVIVGLKSSGISAGKRAYLVMEYLEGEDLSRYLKKVGSLSYGEFQEIFEQCARGLAYAHSKGVVHRDIKPANIFLCKTGQKTSVKIIDMGLAKAVSSSQNEQRLTSTGYVVGTPVYMSPEQCMGQELSTASDIYSLAVVMYEALIGKPPFSAETAMLLMQEHLNAAPTKPEDFGIPHTLSEMIMTCLSKDPRARTHSASELAELLAKLELKDLDGKVLLRQEKKMVLNKRLLASIASVSVLAAAFSTGLLLRDTWKKPVPVIKAKKVIVGRRKGKDAKFYLDEAIGYRKTHHFGQDPMSVQLAQGNLKIAMDLALKERDYNTFVISKLQYLSFEEDKKNPMSEEEKFEYLRNLEKEIRTYKGINSETKYEFYNRLGARYQHQGEYKEARLQFQKALELQSLFHPQLSTLQSIVACSAELDDEKSMRMCIAKMKALEDSETIKHTPQAHMEDTLLAMTYMAGYYCRKNKFSGIAPLLEEISFSTEICTNDTLGSTLNQLSKLCQEKGLSKESEFARTLSLQAIDAAKAYKARRNQYTGRSVAENVQRVVDSKNDEGGN